MKYFIVSIRIDSIIFLLQEDQDWGIVAMVLDRLFLWIFGAAAVIGSFMILTESPSLFEDTEPIDVKFSNIAKEEAINAIEETTLISSFA